MMIGGLGIIRGQGSGGSQTKVAPFWMDPYPSEIGDEMSTIEEAWIEAVARALCKADGWTSRDVAHAWKAYRSLARAAIRALTPLIIERCAEVADPGCDAPCGCAGCECGKTDDAEAQSAWREGARIAAAIRALIPKEADHA